MYIYHICLVSNTKKNTLFTYKKTIASPSYYYICVPILLYMCPHTVICIHTYIMTTSQRKTCISV